LKKEKVKKDLEDNGKENLGYMQKMAVKIMDNLQINIKYFLQLSKNAEM